ncbi:MAG: TolC family protein [Calditrichaeota bacterium]|nr:MAG: TolC family protein [Calditrichota bacterium]
MILRLRTLFWILVGALALQAAPADSLGLVDVVELALQRSWRLKGDSALVGAEEKAVQAQRSRFYPRVSLQGHHFQFFYNQYNYKEQGAELVLDWLPGNWFMRLDQVQQRAVSAQQKSVQAARLEVAGRTIGLYMALQTAWLELNQLQVRQEMLRQHLEINRGLWQAGVRTELDVIQTRQALQQVVEALILQQGRVSALTRQLALQLGRAPDQPLPLAKLDPARWIRLLHGDSLPARRPRLAGHPQLQALKFQEEFLRLSKKKVNASLWPQLQLGTGYVIDRDPTGSGNYAIAALQFQLPLFQWGASRLKKQELEARARAVGWQYRQTERQFQQQLQHLAEQQDALNNALKAQGEEIRLAEQALELAQANYRSGLSTNLDVLFAQQKLFESRLRLARTRMALLENLLQTRLLTGNLKTILTAGARP